LKYHDTTIASIKQNVKEMAKEIGLDVEVGNIHDLLDSHTEGIST
jgi:hypothetical protein